MNEEPETSGISEAPVAAPSPNEPEATPAHSMKTIAIIAVVVVLLALPLWKLLAPHQPPTPAPTAAAPTAAATLPALEALVRANPTPANRINLSVEYLRLQKTGQATALLYPLAAEQPKNAVVWNNLCVAHTLELNLPTAIKECNTAVSLDPKMQLAKDNLKWAEGEKQKALDAVAASGKIPTASRNDAFYLALGLNLMHLGSYDAAIETWQTQLKLNPKSAAAANNIGMAYMLKNSYDEAGHWFARAAELDPSMQLAKNNLAWATSEKAHSGGQASGSHP